MRFIIIKNFAVFLLKSAAWFTLRRRSGMETNPLEWTRRQQRATVVRSRCFNALSECWKIISVCSHQEATLLWRLSARITASAWRITGITEYVKSEKMLLLCRGGFLAALAGMNVREQRNTAQPAQTETVIKPLCWQSACLVFTLTFALPALRSKAWPVPATPVTVTSSHNGKRLKPLSTAHPRFSLLFPFWH